jgi:glycosyltransferase involved in cell wall biosynthesis
VTSHPIQYQAPWFQSLAREHDLVVFFAHRQDARGQAAAGFGHEFEWDVPLLDGYQSEWLRNESAAPGVDTFAGCDTPEIAERLRAGRFDACLVNGWYLKSYLQAVRACRRLGVPVLMRGDSHLKTRRHPLLALGKHLPYRWLLGRVSAHLYVGEANRRYLRHYGVRPERLFFAPHFVDNVRFAAAADRAHASGDAGALRHRMGADPGTRVCLFAGKLIDRKRPADFIDAIARLQHEGMPVLGAVVGSGPLAEALADRALARGARISFLGFRNQTEIPACYAAADCLVLPSDGRETWGLVVNEAMACGVPAVVSDAVGCGEDLVDAMTGAIYPVGQTAALADRLGRLLIRIDRERPRIRQAVLDKIGAYSCTAAVAGTNRALRFVLETSPESTAAEVLG